MNLVKYEFYDKKRHDFIEKHLYDKCQLDCENKMVFDDAKAALGYRLNQDKNMKNFDEIYIKNDVSQCFKFSESPKSYHQFFNQKSMQLTSKETVNAICINPKFVEDETLFMGFRGISSLSYEGLCAFMALTPTKDLMKMGKVLNNAIDGAFESEMRWIDFDTYQASDEIRDIGENYAELKSCFLLLCDDYLSEQGKTVEFMTSVKNTNKYEETKTFLSGIGAEITSNIASDIPDEKLGQEQ